MIILVFFLNLDHKQNNISVTLKTVKDKIKEKIKNKVKNKGNKIIKDNVIHNDKDKDLSS